MPRDLEIGNGGWVRLTIPEAGGGPIYIRFAQIGDRLGISEMYMTGGVDSDLLRRLRLSELLAHVNSSQVRPAILEGIDIPGPDLRRLASHFARTYVEPKAGHLGSDPRNWVERSFRAKDQRTGEPEAPDLEEQKSNLIKKRVRLARDAAKFDIPKGPRPDRFYQRVANVYSALASGGESPAPVIAEANGVPITTVHRWIKEARRRGFLPPGQRGRVG